MVHVARPRLLGHGGQYEEPWKNFHILPYDLEIRVRPWGARAKNVGLHAAVVAHVRRQAGGALNKRERRRGIEIGGPLRGIDLDGRGGYAPEEAAHFNSPAPFAFI